MKLAYQKTNLETAFIGICLGFAACLHTIRTEAQEGLNYSVNRALLLNSELNTTQIAILGPGDGLEIELVDLRSSVGDSPLDLMGHSIFHAFAPYTLKD